MKAQIPLSFPVRESYEPEDFLPLPCNQEAYDWIRRFPDWQYPALIIYGEKGCGKTHILTLSSGKNIKVIDDVQNIFGNIEKEQQLFHEFNRAKENGTYLLLAMDKVVALQPINIPDLASRLKAAPQIEIQQPDEISLQAILVKLLHDRQLQVEPGVIAYILPRIERTFVAAQSLVQKIDENSLAEKRSVTVPLVRAILQDPVLL